jgi:hypothetical protein
MKRSLEMELDFINGSLEVKFNEADAKEMRNDIIIVIQDLKRRGVDAEPGPDIGTSTIS